MLYNKEWKFPKCRSLLKEVPWVSNALFPYFLSTLVKANLNGENSAVKIKVFQLGPAIHFLCDSCAMLSGRIIVTVFWFHPPRFGRRRILLLALAVTLFFGAMTAFSGSYLMFVVMRSLCGVGLTGISIISLILGEKSWTRSESMKHVSIHSVVQDCWYLSDVLLLFRATHQVSLAPSCFVPALYIQHLQYAHTVYVHLLKNVFVASPNWVSIATQIPVWLHRCHRHKSEVICWCINGKQYNSSDHWVQALFGNMERILISS